MLKCVCCRDSILIFKAKLPNDQNDSSATNLELSFLSVIPITKNLIVSVAQLRVRPKTLDLRPGQYVPPSPRRQWNSVTLFVLITVCGI